MKEIRHSHQPQALLSALSQLPPRARETLDIGDLKQLNWGVFTK
jgi:hypothetical protein